MISVVRLYNTIMQSAKTGTSGYQTVDKFNDDLAAVQTDILTTFRPGYESNQMVRDLLGPFVKSVAAATTLPPDYFSFISAVIGGNPSYPISNNEVGLYTTSPVRSPAKSGQSYHYFVNGAVQFLTSGSLLGTMTYMRHPDRAYVTETIVSTDDSDYSTIIVGSDLEWPESAFNLFYYKMLERLGVEMKEALLMEYARFGIQSEIVKAQ